MKMKRKVQDANAVITEMGRQLLETGKEMRMVQTMQVNIYSTMEVLAKCIPGVCGVYGCGHGVWAWVWGVGVGAYVRAVCIPVSVKRK